MKRYIRSAILLPELYDVMDEYNTRLDRYNARMEDWDRHCDEWRTMYDAWQKELKTNPDAPRPEQELMIAPWCDPEYSMSEARHKLTVETLNCIAGMDLWVKMEHGWWIKVLSRTKNPRKYIHYTYQIWNECSLGSGSFIVKKLRDDKMNDVSIPITIVSEYEFCQKVADKFSYVIHDPAQIEDWIYSAAHPGNDIAVR